MYIHVYLSIYRNTAMYLLYIYRRVDMYSDLGRGGGTYLEMRRVDVQRCMISIYINAAMFLSTYRKVGS